jgi:N-terminal domain of galactosyltransferase/N-terminal region of glycosyl transferase group 7
MSRVVYLIPFRNEPDSDRDKQLAEWTVCMDRLHTMSGVSFCWIVGEHTQDGNKFNRGVCINVAADKGTEWLADWFVIHDCDLIPSQEHFERSYLPLFTRSAELSVVHMASSWTKYKYPTFLGGVLAVPCHLFWSCGGMPISFFGWGGEDDAFSYRLERIRGVVIERFEKS